MNSALVLAVVLEVSYLKQNKRGTFLWLLYDLAWSTPGRVERSGWVPSDPPRPTPRGHGLGYALSRHSVARPLGLV